MNYLKICVLIASLLLLYACSSTTGKTNEEKATAENKSIPASADGARLYQVHCAVCHAEDGTGKAELYPPLQHSEYIRGDKERLIGIVLNGLSGEIVVDSISYNSVMAPFNYLKDEQLSALLTWVRGEFGNGAGPVKPEEVKAAR